MLGGCHYKFVTFWNVSCYHAESPSLLTALIILAFVVLIGFILGNCVHSRFPTPWRKGFLSELPTRPTPPEAHAVPPPVYFPLQVISPPRPPSVCSYFHLTHGD